MEGGVMEKTIDLLNFVDNLEKIKEAILYVSKLSKGDPRFGAIKLNKILYYADFRAYRELGNSISNATYQHLNEGPAPRELLPAIEELIKGKVRF